MAAVGVAPSIGRGVKLVAQLFVVFVGDAAFLCLIRLQEFPDDPAVSRSLHLFLSGMVLLVGLFDLLLHAVRTNK